MPEQLSKIGNNLVKRFQTRDPFVIARELGITVLFVNDLSSLKGAYRIIKKQRFIFINANLPEQMQRIVCAHEIGHDRLHRAMAGTSGMMEFMLYDMKSRPEYEANIVAADILLDDEEILSYIYEGQDAEQIANTMHSDINLVALKVDSLIRKGHDFVRQDHKSNFLR